MNDNEIRENGIKRENGLRELGKIYGFETSQQRSERILKKILEELEKEIDERLE